MSKENVALFIQAVNKSAGLKDRVAGSGATPESWVRIAFEEGYDFTAAELTSAIEQTLGRDLGTANPVREYLAAQDSVGSRELNQKLLERVVGGMRHLSP